MPPDLTVKIEDFTDSRGNKRTRRFFIDGRTGKRRVETSLPTFIPSGIPQSYRKLAMEARKRGVKPSVPEEGESWEQERDAVIKSQQAEKLLAQARYQRDELMETAKMLLAVYCRKNSIDDAECQRIADRINYEYSEKNHLRNAKPLKSTKDITEKKIARMIEKMKGGKAQKKIEQALKEEIGAPKEECLIVWRFLKIGETILAGDEQTHRGDATEIWYPIAQINVGIKHICDELKFRRRIIPAKQ